MTQNGDIHSFPKQDRSYDNNGGSGGDSDSRLRKLEVDVGKIQERIKGMQENMATKKDISDVKIWILGGVISVIVFSTKIPEIVAKIFP